MKEIIACLLCLMLLPIHAAAQETPSLKQKTLDIPVGEFVEVRTTDKSTIRGRIGEATDDVVAIETIRAGKPEVVQVEFARMESIRVTSPVEPSTGAKVATNAGKGLVAALAVIGGALLIVAAVTASR